MLYTGPMYVKYNAALRGFPEVDYKSLKGNKYATTITCIVSGIIKLSRVMVMPDKRLVYRGMIPLFLFMAFDTLLTTLKANKPNRLMTCLRSRCGTSRLLFCVVC